MKKKKIPALWFWVWLARQRQVRSKKQEARADRFPMKTGGIFVLSYPWSQVYQVQQYFFLFIFFSHFLTLSLSSFWTSRGHRCRPFSSPVQYTGLPYEYQAMPKCAEWWWLMICFGRFWLGCSPSLDSRANETAINCERPLARSKTGRSILEGNYSEAISALLGGALPGIRYLVPGVPGIHSSSSVVVSYP